MKPITIGRLPWVTAGLVAASLLAACIPGAAAGLAYDRGAVSAGRVWLLLTGQIAHWTPRMLAADLSLLALAGAWLELRCRRRMVAALACGALMAGAAVHFVCTGLTSYRGSSGVASALFVAAAFDVARSSAWRGARQAGWWMLGLFLAKVLLESWTGDPLAAGSFPEGVHVAPASHLCGAAGGALAVAAQIVMARIRDTRRSRAAARRSWSRSSPCRTH